MTEIPTTPMGAERANYAAARLLTHLGSWQHYAAEPPNDLEHAKDKLAALARVMKSMREDIIEKWHWHMVHDAPSEAWENDTPPMADPRIVETYARRNRERTQAR